MQRQVNRGNKSRDVILPAPILGLNKRDSLSSMQPLYAVVMDNYIPVANKITLRPGYSLYAKLTDERKKVETLAAYNKPNYNRFIAVCAGEAYNVSSKVETPKYEVSFIESRCQTVQYKNYLYFMNGIDKPKVFYIDDSDVEHFEDWGFSAENLLPERIISGAVSKEFLWFVEKNTLKAWYAKEAGNVSGELYSFDLAQVAKWGGQLMAVANWTVDGGGRY